MHTRQRLALFAAPWLLTGGCMSGTFDLPADRLKPFSYSSPISGTTYTFTPYSANATCLTNPDGSPLDPPATTAYISVWRVTLTR